MPALYSLTASSPAEEQSLVTTLTSNIPTLFHSFSPSHFSSTSSSAPSHPSSSSSTSTSTSTTTTSSPSSQPPLPSSSFFVPFDVLDVSCWREIFSFINIHDVPSVARTCSQFNMLINDRYFWLEKCKHLVLVPGPHHTPSTDWRTLYKLNYRVPRGSGYPPRKILNYGPLVMGAIVVLGKHNPLKKPKIGDGSNWKKCMDKYYGVQARVTRLSGVDKEGCIGVRVDVDSGKYFWRIRDCEVWDLPEELPKESS